MYINQPVVASQSSKLDLVFNPNVFVTILNLHPNFLIFSTIYYMLSVTHSSLIPSRAAQTATKSPDKSPDGPPD